MKTIKNMIVAGGMMLLMLTACEKDEQRLIAGDGVAPELGNAPASIVLLEEQATTDSITFSWSAADYGYQAAIEYTLQFAMGTADFENAINVDLGSEQSRTYSVGDFNALALRLGLEPESATEVAYRVLASISDQLTAVSSQVQTIAVTAYSTYREIPKLYVPGSHQGWSPETAPKLADMNFSDVFRGYVYFPDASNEFKLTVAPCWCEPDYGSPGGNQLTLGGGDNIEHSGQGYYRLTANLKNNTWQAEIMGWGLIGDAVGGWNDGDDIPLVYHAETRTLRAEVAMSPGPWKFRANGGWDINLGGGEQPGTLAYGGSDFNLETGGTYLVILDLSNPEQYTYSLELQ